MWSQKEVESYLLIPTALHKISGRTLAEVQKVVAASPGTAGKNRLGLVLRELGIPGTPNNVIVQNALANSPEEIPPELMEVPQKIGRKLGLSAWPQVFVVFASETPGNAHENSGFYSRLGNSLSGKFSAIRTPLALRFLLSGIGDEDDLAFHFRIFD